MVATVQAATPDCCYSVLDLSHFCVGMSETAAAGVAGAVAAADAETAAAELSFPRAHPGLSETDAVLGAHVAGPVSLQRPLSVFRGVLRPKAVEIQILSAPGLSFACQTELG